MITCFEAVGPQSYQRCNVNFLAPTASILAAANTAFSDTTKRRNSGRLYIFWRAQICAATIGDIGTNHATRAWTMQNLWPHTDTVIYTLNQSTNNCQQARLNSYQPYTRLVYITISRSRLVFLTLNKTAFISFITNHPAPRHRHRTNPPTFTISDYI